MPSLRQRKFVLKKPSVDPTRTLQLSAVFARRKQRERKEKEKSHLEANSNNNNSFAVSSVVNGNGNGDGSVANGNGHSKNSREGFHDGMDIVDERLREDLIKEEKDEEEISPAEKVKMLEEKLDNLQQQKHKLFLLLKQVLNEDEKRKQAEREKKLLEQKKEEALRLAAEREEQKARAEREGAAAAPSAIPPQIALANVRSPAREGLTSSREGLISSTRRDRSSVEIRPIEGRERIGDGRVGDGRAAEGRIAEGRIVEGRIAEGRIAEGRIAESRIGEGRVVERYGERIGEGRVGERIGEGRVAERISEGRISERGEGRIGDGRPGETRMGESRMGDSRMGEGKQYPPHIGASVVSPSSQSYSSHRRGSNQYSSGLQHSEPPPGRRAPGSPPPVPLSSMHSPHVNRYEGQSSYGYAGQGGPNYIPGMSAEYAQQNMLLANLGQMPGMMHHMLPAQLALQLQLQQLGMQPRMSGQSHLPPYSHPLMGHPGGRGILSSPPGASHHPSHSRGGDDRRRGGRGRMMGGGHW